MKKIGYVVLTIILTFMVIFNLCSILDVSFLEYRLYRIGSGSMSPELKVGEYILVKKSYKYKVGDIVTYKKKDNYITHRIVYKKGNTIITKGDKNNLNDEPINKKNIVGKLVRKLKVVSLISYLLSIPFTWILIFILGISYILIFSKNKETV